MRYRHEDITSRVVRGIELGEDGIHAIVAVLLGGLGVVLVADTTRRVVVLMMMWSDDLVAVAIGVLDETLVLFIMAELLHTVAIALRHHGALDPEPFLVVGLVAGIRRVLILTAEAERSFRWNPEGIELLILMTLILVMAITTYVWRHSYPRDGGASSSSNEVRSVAGRRETGRTRGGDRRDAT
jgi:uncharacterized membrane protein (DUF373 family)